jgi:hypothetical protein
MKLLSAVRNFLQKFLPLTLLDAHNFPEFYLQHSRSVIPSNSDPKFEMHTK